jgi:hypothetical protein
MHRFVLSLGVLSLVLGIPSVAAQCTPADLILSNGHIITMDSGRRVGSAVAVRDGRIEAVGTDQAVAGCAGVTTRKVDLEGASRFHRCPHARPVLG